MPKLEARRHGPKLVTTEFIEDTEILVNVRVPDIETIRYELFSNHPELEYEVVSGRGDPLTMRLILLLQVVIRGKSNYVKEWIAEKALRLANSESIEQFYNDAKRDYENYASRNNIVTRQQQARIQIDIRRQLRDQGFLREDPELSELDPTQEEALQISDNKIKLTEKVASMFYRIETDEQVIKKRVYEIEADSKEEALDAWSELTTEEAEEEFIFSEGTEQITLVEFLDEDGNWENEETR